jgi:hypothetical protein
MLQQLMWLKSLLHFIFDRKYLGLVLYTLQFLLIFIFLFFKLINLLSLTFIFLLYEFKERHRIGNLVAGK